MPGLFDTLHAWARKTATSFAPRQGAATGGLIYRLRSWPSLPASSRTADVLRTLSVMSQRPVNRNWILMSSGLKPFQVDRLLQSLVDQNVVDVIDSAGFRASVN